MTFNLRCLMGLRHPVPTITKKNVGFHEILFSLTSIAYPPRGIPTITKNVFVSLNNQVSNTHVMNVITQNVSVFAQHSTLWRNTLPPDAPHEKLPGIQRVSTQSTGNKRKSTQLTHCGTNWKCNWVWSKWYKSNKGRYRRWVPACKKLFGRRNLNPTIIKNVSSLMKSCTIRHPCDGYALSQKRRHSWNPLLTNTQRYTTRARTHLISECLKRTHRLLIRKLLTNLP